jgi:hypothetical protein
VSSSRQTLTLAKKYPASDFKSVSERAQAIINEIETMLLPAIDKADAAGTLSMIESAMTFSGDLFDRELALDERLNAMIDRAIKRLIQIKAMKQMLNQVPNRPKSEVLKLRAPNT